MMPCQLQAELDRAEMSGWVRGVIVGALIAFAVTRFLNRRKSVQEPEPKAAPVAEGPGVVAEPKSD